MEIDQTRSVELFDCNTGKEYTIFLDALNSQHEGLLLANILKNGISERKVVLEIPKEFLKK